MQRFEWVNAQSEAEAAGSGATTVAAAMIVPTGGRALQDAVIVKAGGIDLLDLMKEGLLQPRRIVNLRSVTGLDRIVEEKDGAVRVLYDEKAHDQYGAEWPDVLGRLGAGPVAAVRDRPNQTAEHVAARSHEQLEHARSGNCAELRGVHKAGSVD